MALSKFTRISIMLGIDIAFFILELSVGVMVGSLALLADAFHMLNDIISLLVGLWAVIVARKATTDKFTYGWLRAEILGAFFNAVFLIALCVSIILEAITRFLDPPQIDNPKLILIVGSLGLASNLVGFVVLGGHGHSHGHEHGEHTHGHAHGQHAHEGSLRNVEEGYAGARVDSPVEANAVPQVSITRTTSQNAPSETTIAFEPTDSRLSSHSRGRLRSGASRHARIQSIDDMAIHPASFRQEIIAASRNQQDSSSDGSSSDESAVDDNEDVTAPHTETSPLLAKDNAALFGPGVRRPRSSSHRSVADSVLHELHNHKKSKKPKKGGHGHSHDDMGMNAMVLHVMGDALGNIGVIVTALVIWLTEWKYKLYADPAVSLFITLIILRSAVPLTLATSKVLLQATPDHIDVSDIREDIESLPGVVSCHHVHIWQLSDTQLVASMHIHVEFPISEAGGEKYMKLARRVRSCLHEYGIHSATIQPEFCTADHHAGNHPPAPRSPSQSTPGQPDDQQQPIPRAQQPQGTRDQGRNCSGSSDSCLLECVDNCAEGGCCREASEGSITSSPGQHDHDHNHEHGYGHDGHGQDHQHDH